MHVPNPPEQAPSAKIVEQLRKQGIHEPRLLEALASVSRERFLPPECRAEAHADRALPIGFDQTISQPSIVAVMTQALKLEGTEHVLEIGTGSGYQTAVLSLLAEQVYTIERVPTLSLRARGILDGLGRSNIRYMIGDGSLGWCDEAPFDRILVTAGVPSFPSKLFRQLTEDGILVVPIGEENAQQLNVVRKRQGHAFAQQILPCRFVKLIGNDAWK